MGRNCNFELFIKQNKTIGIMKHRIKSIVLYLTLIQPCYLIVTKVAPLRVAHITRCITQVAFQSTLRFGFSRYTTSKKKKMWVRKTFNKRRLKDCCCVSQIRKRKSRRLNTLKCQINGGYYTRTVRAKTSCHKA